MNYLLAFLLWFTGLTYSGALPQGAMMRGPVMSPAPSGGSLPTNFAYVASSVTGCFNNTGANNKCGGYALHANPSAGNLIVCTGSWADSGSVSFSMSGSLSGSLTAIGSKIAGTGATAGLSGQNFWVKAAGGGTETITGTASASSGYQSWDCQVFSYTGTLSALDGTPGYSNTAASGGIVTLNGTTMGQNLVTTGTSDLVVATCNGAQGTCSSESPYTTQDDTNACSYTGTSCMTGLDFNGNDGGLLEYHTGVAAGTQTATIGLSNMTGAFYGGMVAF